MNTCRCSDVNFEYASKTVFKAISALTVKQAIHILSIIYEFMHSLPLFLNHFIFMITFLFFDNTKQQMKLS